MKQSKQAIIAEIGSRHLEAYLECASVPYGIIKVKLEDFFDCFCGLPVKIQAQSGTLENQELGCNDSYKMIMYVSSCI